ncbi:MAG: efflux transporter outer membrane subunit [Hyphomicrobiales bacterium]|nr:efflux transporter outer membrane subunit [Hyphomicrobiales bacterium]MBV9907421.1 efflux transporter outer membrane subunit [Hyphomicrobiales bacterium]
MSVARAAPFLASLACSGCAPVGPNFERPAAIVSPQFKEIKGWKIATPRANEPKGEWWSVFHDPELDQLMRVVVVSNQTIKADEANYRQGLALINEARAGLFPTVGGTGSATRSSPSQTNLTAEASGTWTLDVWGQVRRQIEAQQAGAETSAASLANATLAAQSALGLAYVTLRDADSLEDLLTRTVAEFKHSLTITQNQYNAGTAAKSDVITAETQVLNAQAQLIAAGVSRAQSEHAIAVLMGRAPADLSVPHGTLATRVPSIPVGLPSSLVERRPDVAAAEETMRQANAQIGVEFAGYFPAVSLSGLIGYSGNPFATQFGPSNPVWSFGASLAQPFFNGGLTTAQVEAARQTYDADVATYRQTVLTAIQQVEDALAGIRILSQEVKVQAENVRISRQATQITLNEYQAGTQAFTTVVVAETQQLTAEEALLATQFQIQTDIVTLIVALGGGWSQSMLPDVTAQTSAIPPH